MIRKVTWTEVKAVVAAQNSELARAIDGLFSSARMKDRDKDLYVAEYRYGDLIVEKGDFRPPCYRSHPDRQEWCAICKQLISAVQYSAIPLGLSLEHAAEVFLDTEWDPEEPRLAPLRLITPGEPFGVFEVLDTLLGTPFPKPPWSVSAGARSVWILAPLGQKPLPGELAKIVNKRIRYAKEIRPCDLIAASVGDEWRAHILLFPDSLMSDLPLSDPLFRVLLKIGWKQSSAVRHALFRIPRDLMANTSPSGGPLPDIYRVATVRHLIDAAKGEVPVFAPATGTQSGPFVSFQEALRKALGQLDSPYVPVVMQPTHLTDVGDVGYYSFRCPTVVGVKRPYVKNYGDVPLYIREDLMAQKCGDVIDQTNTKFFAQRGKEDVFSAEDLPLSDFYNGDSAPKLYLKSPFLISGVRLVRSAATVPGTNR
jgi:hypothetical protein